MFSFYLCIFIYLNHTESLVMHVRHMYLKYASGCTCTSGINYTTKKIYKTVTLSPAVKNCYPPISLTQLAIDQPMNTKLIFFFFKFIQVCSRAFGSLLTIYIYIKESYIHCHQVIAQPLALNFSTAHLLPCRHSSYKVSPIS